MLFLLLCLDRLICPASPPTCVRWGVPLWRGHVGGAGWEPPGMLTMRPVAVVRNTLEYRAGASWAEALACPQWPPPPGVFVEVTFGCCEPQSLKPPTPSLPLPSVAWDRLGTRTGSLRPVVVGWSPARGESLVTVALFGCMVLPVVLGAPGPKGPHCWAAPAPPVDVSLVAVSSTALAAGVGCPPPGPSLPGCSRPPRCLVLLLLPRAVAAPGALGPRALTTLMTSDATRAVVQTPPDTPATGR